MGLNRREFEQPAKLDDDLRAMLAGYRTESRADRVRSTPLLCGAAAVAGCASPKILGETV